MQEMTRSIKAQNKTIWTIHFAISNIENENSKNGMPYEICHYYNVHAEQRKNNYVSLLVLYFKLLATCSMKCGTIVYAMCNTCIYVLTLPIHRRHHNMYCAVYYYYIVVFITWVTGYGFPCSEAINARTYSQTLLLFFEFVMMNSPSTKTQL